ncbi:MAG: WecB/TagA/CpsF family glycosyltransferase [Brevinema sp.]
MDMKFPEYMIFGIKVTDISRGEWRNYLYDKFHHRIFARIVVLTEKKFFQAMFNKELAETINQAEIVLCSSSMLAWLIAHMYGKIVKPALSVTYVLDALTVASECRSTVSFFGGSKPTLFAAVQKMHKSFKGVKVVSHYPAKIALKDQTNVFIAIRKAAATLGLFNLGNNKLQELWINQNFMLSQSGVVMGTDDSFEIIAGRKHVPPLHFQEKGWLGLYTLLTRPFYFAKIFRLLIIWLFFLGWKMKKSS